MKILICDDHSFYRDGIKSALYNIFPDAVIHEAANAKSALTMIAEHQYDLVLLDIRLPEQSGLQVLQKIQIEHPKVKVIMVSQHNELQFMQQSRKCGAKGYLNKNIEYEDFVLAIHVVMKGQLYFMDERMYVGSIKNNGNDIMKPHDSLNFQELNVMIGLASEKSQIAIATELKLSAKTIFSHKKRMMKKMEFNDHSDLIDYCREHNLIIKKNNI